MKQSMSDPLGYFITWTTYGTWLAGDQRGWVLKAEGRQAPHPEVRASAASMLN